MTINPSEIQSQPTGNDNAANTNANENPFLDLNNTESVSTSLESLLNVSEQPKETPKPEEELTPPDPIKKPEEQQTEKLPVGQKPAEEETPLPDEEIEKLISNDSRLKQYQTLIEAGYSPEDAEKIAYADVLGFTEKEQPKEFDTQAYESPYSKYNPQQISVMANEAYRLATNPTDQDILAYLKNNPEYNLDINELPDFEDPVTNTLIKSTIKWKMQQEFSQQYKNISSYINQQNDIVKQEQELSNKLNDKVYKEFPLLKDNKDPNANKLYSHFQGLFSKNMEGLPKDPKVLEKVLDKTIKQYKAIYPRYCQALGIDTNARKPEMSEKATQDQLLKMQNLNRSSGSTSITDSNAAKFTSIDDTASVSNALEKVLGF